MQKVRIKLYGSSKTLYFLYNAMGNTVLRQGIGIMHSDAMDTKFHSGDA